MMSNNNHTGYRELYAGTADAVVAVEEVASDGSIQRRISGVVWGKSTVITSSHPLDNPERIRVVRSDGTAYPAQVNGWDNRYNLAVLTAETGLSRLQTVDLKDLEPGDLVFTRGFDEIRQGMVARKLDSRRTKMGGELKPWIEVDGTLSMRQEGSALLSADGKLAGLCSLLPQPTGQVLGVEMLEHIVPRILDGGTPSPAYLGIRTAPGADENDSPTLIVTTVDKSSPAFEAGIRSGDIIQKIHGTPLSNPRELFLLLRSFDAGETIEIEVNRGSDIKIIKVKLAVRG
jgi:S1-C subfamily serine protease